jgi:Multiubiquitin
MNDAHRNHDGHQTVIIINGREKETSEKRLSFAQIIALAFPEQPQNPNTLYTVTFRKGDDSRPEGSLIDGQEVKIKKGMVFNVTATDKS